MNTIVRCLREKMLLERNANPRTDFYSKVKFTIRSRSNIAYPTTNMEKMGGLRFLNCLPIFRQNIDMVGYRNEFGNPRNYQM